MKKIFAWIVLAFWWLVVAALVIWGIVAYPIVVANVLFILGASTIFVASLIWALAELGVIL